MVKCSCYKKVVLCTMEVSFVFSKVEDMADTFFKIQITTAFKKDFFLLWAVGS